MNSFVSAAFSFLLLILIASTANSAGEISIRGQFSEGDGFLVKNQKVLTNITQNRADDLCKSLGVRLPTARELAKQAATDGALITPPTKNQDGYSVCTKDYQYVSGYEDYVVRAGYDEFCFSQNTHRIKEEFHVWSSTIDDHFDGESTWHFGGVFNSSEPWLTSRYYSARCFN